MIIKDDHVTHIKVTPKLTKKEIEKLRHDWKHPKQGVDFKSGKHTIVVTIVKGTKEGKPNRITSAGLKVPLVNPSDQASKYFKSITVTVEKLKWTKPGKSHIVKKVIKIPKTATVGELDNVLRKPHHYVSKVMLEFTTVKPVKANLIVKGCVEKVVVPPTTTTKLHTTHSGHTTGSISKSTSTLEFCNSSNIVTNENVTEFRFTPNITNCEEKKLRYGLEKIDVGVHLICGSHSIVMRIKSSGSYRTLNVLSEIGLILVGKDKNDSLIKYFEYIDVIILRHSYSEHLLNPLNKLFIRNIKLDLQLWNIFNILDDAEYDVKTIRFDFKLKANVVFKLNIKGCVKSFIATSTLEPLINDQSFKCRNLKNVLSDVKNVIMKVSPPLSVLEISKLRSIGVHESTGTVISKGKYVIDLSFVGSNPINILEIGVILLEVNNLKLAEAIIKIDKLYLVRQVKSFGKVIPRKMFVSVSNNLSIEDLKNVLSNGYTSISGIHIEFHVKRTVKLFLNIKGCVKFDAIPLASSTTLSSLVNEENYRCTTLRNLLRAVKNIIISISPSLSKTDEDKLRSIGNYPTKGADLSPGLHVIQFALPSNQTVSIVEIGFDLFDENESRFIKGIIKLLEVSVTRISKSFGNIISTKQLITLSDNWTVKDLKNLLSRVYTSINSIHLKFVLKKSVKAVINVKGCYSYDTVTFSPTLTPIINDQSFRCTTLHNLLKVVKNIQMELSPPLTKSDIDKLRSISNYPTKGAYLSSDLHTMEFSFPSGQPVSILEIGIILLNFEDEKPLIDIMEIIEISVTRLSKSFGKIVETKRTIGISNILTVKDVKNVLLSGLTSIGKVYMSFKLKEASLVVLNIKGCYSSDTNVVSPVSTTVGPLVNDEMYNCTSKINLLTFKKIIKISKIPPLPSTINKKLRFSSNLPNDGAPIIKGKQEIDILLPVGKAATIVDLGLNFIGEKDNKFIGTFMKNFTVVIYRLRMSFGQLISSPINLPLPDKLTVSMIKSILKSQYTNVNKIIMKFETIRKMTINIILNGCFSPTVLRTTTLPPVGCLHLNKYYSHGQLIQGRLKCDTKICSDGKTLSVFKCNKKWTGWMKCSKFCGAGETTRRKICILNPLMRGIDKQILIKNLNESCLNKLEVKPCFEQPCQNDCKLTQWSDWSNCDNSTCKNEYQTRLRQLVSDNKNVPCTKPLMESRRCIKSQCPCAENAELNSCANIICPTSCDHMNSRVRCVVENKNCVKACVCKYGYLYQNGKCVHLSNCLCLKPDFNGIILSGKSTGYDNQGTTKPSQGEIGTNNKESSGSINVSKLDNASGGTTKSSNIQITKISKEDLENIIKNNAKTPPWGPGITNPPLYQASPPWFAGTTPAGATIQLPTDSPKPITTKPPPPGMKPVPPDSLTKTTTNAPFIVTQAFIAPLNPNLNPNQNVPNNANNPNNPQSSSNSNPLISSNSPNSQPSGGSQSNNPLIINPNQPPSDNNSTLSTSPTPISNTLSDQLKTRVIANSTTIVNCQSCICTDGQLICSGPNCYVGANVWSDWSVWSPCTAVCGIGLRRRFRKCQGIKCIDDSSPTPGIKRFTAATGIQAEDKKCIVTECSCIFSRELIKIHIGEEQIAKYNIDLGAIWLEKDDIKGLSNVKEIVKPGEVIRNGLTIYAKCNECICKNGQFNCNSNCT